MLRFIHSSSFIYLSLALLLSLTACASTPPAPPPSHNGGLIRERNQGYSLLYKLLSDDAGVNKILYIKHVDEPLASLIKQIASACQDATKQMDEFPKLDKQIEFDVPDLPKVEQESRDLTSKSDTFALLGSSGKDFELYLIFTQAQAMDDATHLSQAMFPREDNPARKDFLTNLAHQCDDFHTRLMKLLTVKS
jgi:hypothetical protein